MNKLLHPADQICQIMERIYANRMTTVSGGNLSLRDEEGHVWVSPSGGDKGNLSRRDVCEILPDGSVVGNGKPSLEFMVHKEILRIRPDLKAILHAHPPALVTMSIMRRIPNIFFLPETLELCGGIEMARYALPGSSALVENVSGVFARGCNTVVLENHGVFIGSTESLFDAYKIFETLDFMSRIELQAPLLSGKAPNTLSDVQIERYNALKDCEYAAYMPGAYSNEELLLRESVCQMTRRAYQKQLFNSTQGAISVRTGQDTFIITPEGKDNAYLAKKDFVQVKGKSCEEGKHPHHTAFIHEALYKKDSDIMSVIVATSPSAATFVVTGEPYDVCLIPECFNRLQATRIFSFDTLLNCPEEIVGYLSLKTPVAIIENAFYIVVSISPFAAYDRMEIFEYTAQSVLYAKSMGQEVIKITEEQIGALKGRFKIPKPEPMSL
jgi:L-fuculose-phosphate aldolase